MATGFTHKTREELQTLTAKEMDLVPRLVEIIFKHQGICNRISRRELEKIMILKGVGPERLTDMLRYIRLNNLLTFRSTFAGSITKSTTSPRKWKHSVE